MYQRKDITHKEEKEKEEEKEKNRQRSVRPKSPLSTSILFSISYCSPSVGPLVSESVVANFSGDHRPLLRKTSLTPVDPRGWLH